jgi:hypothetical protein
MLKSVQWNVYTYLMVGLVPAMLLGAWGIDSWQSRRLHQTQCQVATEWLEESARLAPQFTLANTMDRTQFWRVGIEELNAPSQAGVLRRGILQSASYHARHYPDHPTSEPEVLNREDGLFSRDIEGGAAALIAHCPETEALLPTAFPMFFQGEDEN